MIVESLRSWDIPKYWDIVLRQICRLDGAIEKEFTLISDRMTWMIISESFIFGPFTLAATSYTYAPKAFANVILGMLLILPLLGIAIGAYALFAIRAAHEAADFLKDTRKEMEGLLPDVLRVNLIDVTYRKRERGTVPSSSS